MEINDSNYFQDNNFIDNFLISQNNLDNNISPGRKRLISNSKNQAIEWDFNQDFEDSINLKRGDKVFHQKFGYGKIIFLEGDKATVNFKKSSQKKVIIKYLKFIN